MAFVHFLAMTAAEYAAAAPLPRHVAWMACHFSPYATGLSNLPVRLPEGSLLILNDRTPMNGQDPQRVLAQLEKTIREQHCFGLLLDLQRPGVEEAAQLAQLLYHRLPCPVCVTPEYAPEGCPVFLPPLPVDQTPQQYFAPWAGREIWLESALSTGEILLTPEGAKVQPVQPEAELPFRDEKLYCHYRIDMDQDAVRFPMRRTPEDLNALLEAVQAMGVTNAVGLYQELGER